MDRGEGHEARGGQGSLADDDRPVIDATSLTRDEFFAWFYAVAAAAHEARCVFNQLVPEAYRRAWRGEATPGDVTTEVATVFGVAQDEPMLDELPGIFRPAPDA